MIRVFAYLAWRSATNRLTRQVRKLRSPRYLAALVLGLGYLWVVALQQRRQLAAPAVVGSHAIELLGAIGVVGVVLWSWIFGVERRVLAFTPTEVTFLFSAPIPRRGLVQYKLLRNQLLILFNAILWTLILAHERFGASSWLRALSIWVLLTTISFHRLGASFVRTSLLEHGRPAVHHRLVSLTLLGGLLGALAWSVRDALPTLAAGWAAGLLPFCDALDRAAGAPLPHLVLAPFRAMIRPLAAHSIGEWLRAIGPAVGLLLAHYIWVIRADTAFEEASAEAALRRARGRSGRASRVPTLAHRRLPPMLRLAPVGWPAGGILWKNLLGVVRTRRARNVARALAAAAVVGGVLSLRGPSTIGDIAGWLAATWAALSIVIGPQWVRNDLRHDLLKLDLLRSYPVPGRAVVAAEVAASTAVLTALQSGLFLVAYLTLLGNTTSDPTLELRTVILLVALASLPGINFLGMLIQNGVALLLPAWSHLGGGRPGGVEALGQNMLMIIGYSVLLSIVLALPATLAAGVFLELQDAMGWWACAPAIAVLHAGIAAEALWLLRWLGRVFETTEPAAAEIAA